MAVGEGFARLRKIRETVEKVTHRGAPWFNRCALCVGRWALGVGRWALGVGRWVFAQNAQPSTLNLLSARHLGVPACVVPPGDDDAQAVEHDKHPQRELRSAGAGDGAAIALGDEEAAVGAKRPGKADGGSALGVAVLDGLGLAASSLPRSARIFASERSPGSCGRSSRCLCPWCKTAPGTSGRSR